MTEGAFDDVLLKVEATLFAYGDWLTIDDIRLAVHSDSSKLVENALADLKKKYGEGYAFRIVSDDSSRWKMVLKEEFEDTVSDLVSGVEIPKNVLKVLSVIAYEQPVTKTRLSEILGRSVKPEVDYLYKAKFVDYKKQGIGRYYSVTKKFFDYFKIDDEEEFRKQANQELSTFLEEPNQEVPKQETPNEEKQD